MSSTVERRGVGLLDMADGNGSSAQWIKLQTSRTNRATRMLMQWIWAAVHLHGAYSKRRK